MSEELQADTVEQVQDVQETASEDVTPVEQEISKPEETSTEPEQSKTPEIVEKKPFIEGLTYETPEDLVKGVKEKDATISKTTTELKQLKEKISQYEQALQKQGFQSPQQVDDVVIERQLQGEYSQAFEYLTGQYMRYVDPEIQPTNLDELLEVLPSKLSAQLAIQIKGLDDEFMSRKTQLTTQRQQEALKAQENFKNSLYEVHADHKDILDLFFDSQPTPEKAIALKEQIAKQAVEAYKNSLNIEQQNTNDKQRLQSGVDVGVGATPQTQKIFTRAEIKNMSSKEYAKYEAIIDEQVSRGLIK